jgi:hypothetical protein
VWLQGNGLQSIGVSNAEGVFQLKVPVSFETALLRCSYAGYKEEMVRVPLTADLTTVTLQPLKSPAAKRKSTRLATSVRGATRPRAVLPRSRR